jgi:hypothetical protein
VACDERAVDNLHQYFGELPDVRIVERLAGRDTAPARFDTPLLLESIQRFSALKATLPLPADFLDYTSMWTSWSGAVPPPR